MGHPARSTSLKNLATCLYLRYNEQHMLKDLEEAIGLHNESLNLPQDGDQHRSGVLCDLAACLHARYNRKGDIHDLEEATRFLREALVHSASEKARPMTLNNLANCLQDIYEYYGTITNLEEAVQCHRDALLLHSPDHPNRPVVLSNLGNSLRELYAAKGETRLIEEALQHHEAALDLRPKGHRDRVLSLKLIGTCFWIYFKREGNLDILDQAVRYHRDAVVVCPVDHPKRPLVLNSLAHSLCEVYVMRGDIEHLEEATRHYREALRLCPPGHPHRSESLNNFATCLETWHSDQAGIQYLVEAIHCHRELLLLHPPGHPKRSSTLNNLANVLHGLPFAEPESQRPKLDEIIQYHREALSYTPPGHRRRSASLVNLANCLQDRYELDKAGNIQDLEEAIQLQREGLVLHPLGHSERPKSLNNLANCLNFRYHEYHRDQDLEEAIQLIQESLRLYPPYHPSLTTAWVHLASLYAQNRDVLKSKHDVETFSELFRKATIHPSASLKERLWASWRWTKHETGTQKLWAYHRCLELANQYLLIRPFIAARHQLLWSVPDNIASDAAAYAISIGDFRKAVEFLEQGRTLLWSQIGHFHTPLDALQIADPSLAMEFKDLSQKLEASALTSTTTEQNQALEQEAPRYRQLMQRWKSTIDKIHRLPGFGNFLEVPRYDKLQDAAQNGPVVILNVSDIGSKAIIVQKTNDPIIVDLPDATPSYVQRLCSGFREAVSTLRDDASSPNQGKSSRGRILSILRSLWEDIVGPVAIKLNKIQVPPGSRIWWCPTTELAMLPLHAAGPYRKQQVNMVDCYISSYTPTLIALVNSSRSRTTMPSSSSCPHLPNILTIATEQASGQKDIPWVKPELAHMWEAIPSGCMDILLDEEGTRRAAMAGLKTHRWIHFASHGSQSLSAPFESCFHLYDEPLTLLDIVEARLPDAQFAYLSACHSASGDVRNPDEFIHLAAALQFSGFRSVIGTMYAMADVDGPLVAKEVYKYMFRRVGKGKGTAEEPIAADYRDAAEALHIATSVLREKGVPVERWINFIHIGA
ncbi:hypothetical protein FRC03_009891 [Tulasnella sp. 419]|nr:hypothetical protein FRC03_009891 [Tulasnella sp. 419]